ncbi:MAG: hypothetical protein Q4D73_06655 [Actinomycetaceae bacterium]|nr:hypothetical protein [Actinomycetaceae bacterium]
MNENRINNLITAAQAVEMIPFVNKAQLLRWARTGKIPAVRLPSNRVLFKKTDIEALLSPVILSEDKPSLPSVLSSPTTQQESSDVPLPGFEGE